VQVTGRYGWATIKAQLVNMRDGGFISARLQAGRDDRRDRSGGDIDQGVRERTVAAGHGT
jgi:3-hydroxyacyl-CoA dehydrogenase